MTKIICVLDDVEIDPSLLSERPTGSVSCAKLRVMSYNSTGSVGAIMKALIDEIRPLVKVLEIILKHDGKLYLVIEDRSFGQSAEEVDAVSLGIQRHENKMRNRNTSPRFYKNPYLEDVIGAIGEREFAMQFNLSVNEDIIHRGDNGIDFYSEAGSIDVKIAQKPKHCLIKEKDVDRTADILVQAKIEVIDGDNLRFGEVSFLGWDYGKNVKNWTGPKDFGRLGIISYGKRSDDLNGMEALRSLMGVSSVYGESLHVPEILASYFEVKGWELKENVPLGSKKNLRCLLFEKDHRF